MSKKLKSAVIYSEDRVPIMNLDLENYVTTDNLLQNKKGKIQAVNLPPQGGNVTRFESGDILIANIRPYLKKIWLAKHQGGSSADVLTLKVNSKNDPAFIYYALHRDVFFEHVMNGSKGTKMPRGDKNQVLEFPIPDFEKPIQSKIAKVLSDLDAKIELNNKINEELEAMAKLIYDYWFVQFDFPISKEQALQMGKQELEGKPYKSSGGKMTFNKELKREIPVGWDIGTLLDIADFSNGIACQKYRPQKGEESYRVIKIREMGDGYTDKTEFVSQNIPERVVVRNGDVLFSWSATLDVKIWTGGIGGLNQHIFRVSSDKYPRTYYYFEVFGYLQFFKMVAELRKTTMGHITQDHLKQSRIVIPPINLIEKLHEVINPIIEKTISGSEENQKLTELRDWLLPMLMNGQVTVGEAEKELSKAAEPGVVYDAGGKAKILPLFPPRENQYYVKRKMLACYIINQSLEDPNFGDTKFEKLLHLSDYWVLKRNFQQRYYQQAAGPYDNTFTNKFFDEVLKAKWYRKISYGAMNRIVGAENQEKSTKTYDYFSKEELGRINQLIKYFRKKTYEEPEIISTLYAVWNNRLILGQSVSDNLLKQDFLDWDVQKKKYKDRLDGALQWMRDEGLVPDGWGKFIDKPKNR